MEMYSEVEALFEGNLLAEESQMWGREMSFFEEKVDRATTSHSPVALQSKGEEALECQLNFNHEVSTPSLNPNDSYLNTFQDLIDAFELNGKDILMGIKVDNEQSIPFETSCSKIPEPLSPAGSFDSGIASPGNADCLSWSPENASPSLYGDYSLPETPSSQGCEISEDFLNELGIELLPEQVEAAAEVPVSTCLENVPLNSFENALSFPLEAHTSELPVLVNTSQDTIFQLVSSSVPQQPVAVQTSAKPQSGRKSKVTGTEERKQRKRDQNKVAATRYRERKRQENDQRETEFNRLSSKNKKLADKASQITREIDYLKELMIEVYTIKGLIA